MATIEELEAMGFEVVHLDVGNRVICDSCNEEYTNSAEEGGVLFNRTAFCPKCTPRIVASAIKCHEERFLQYPIAHETFRDFILRIR
jgi:hypothetical protein